MISAITSRGARGQGDRQPRRLDLDLGPDGGAVEQHPGPVGLGALDLEGERCSRQQFGDRPLADDVAPIHDGDGVTGPFDLVQEVRGQDDGPALGHQGKDHVPHLVHAGGVEPVHGLVEDEELRVAEEAGRHSQALAHAHGVLRHPVVGAVDDADPLQCRLDAVTRRGLACRRQDLEVLPSAQMPVEAGLVHDGADPGEGHVPLLRDGETEQRHGAGVGVGQAQQHPDERGLARTVRTEVAERTSPGNEELDAVHRHVVPEAFRQPVRLDGPALGRGRPRPERAGPGAPVGGRRIQGHPPEDVTAPGPVVMASVPLAPQGLGSSIVVRLRRLSTRRKTPKPRAATTIARSRTMA